MKRGLEFSRWLFLSFGKAPPWRPEPARCRFATSPDTVPCIVQTCSARARVATAGLGRRGVVPQRCPHPVIPTDHPTEGRPPVSRITAGLVASYLGEADPKNPLASPLYGDLSGLPPIRVH